MLSGTVCLLDSSGSHGIGILLVCLAGMGIGAFLFFRGFRMLRFKRLILNTPLSRIHSASIGIVEVNGTPAGPHILSAPITGDPCYYYRVRAWQWVESGKDHEWKSVLDESLYVPFFLEDSTGRVLVDPQGADLDVHRSFYDEVGSSFLKTPGLIPPNVLKFLATRGLVPQEKIRLEERIIPRGFPLFVFGTLGDNPARTPGPARPGLSSGEPSPDKSAFGEFESQPSVAICKGERNEPFAISGHSQKEVVSKLAWKSTLHIWGGPVLAITSLYFLLSFWQLLSP